MQFKLTEEDMEKVAAWNAEQDKIAYKKQMKQKNFGVKLAHFLGKPDYGACGGSLTYSFTPTGLGCVIKVKHEYTGNELDLTDVDNW